MGTATMAKKKAAATAKIEEAAGPRKTALTLKGSPEWREWLEGFAKSTRMPISTLVDHALVKYAQEMGYAAKAPER